MDNHQACDEKGKSYALRARALHNIGCSPGGERSCGTIKITFGSCTLHSLTCSSITSFIPRGTATKILYVSWLSIKDSIVPIGKGMFSSAEITTFRLPS